MRMWRPERAANGPLPVRMQDVPALNRLFADAFTDRYRRDGLAGVRVPFLNEAIWRYAITGAGEGAMLWRDEAERLVAFNIAHHSGREGWMGPLCVRPDRQLSGLGREIVGAAVTWLQSRGVTTLGLETMPRTVDNIGFYSRLGFLPGYQTLTMTREVKAARKNAQPLLSQLGQAARETRLAGIAALVESLSPGYDFSRDIAVTLDLGLGDVVTLDQDGALAGFALCHAAPLAEGSGRDEVRVLKIAATGVAELMALLNLVADWAGSMAIRRVAVRCQTAYSAAYRALVSAGWKVRWSDLRMTLEGFGEQVPEGGVVWSNWEI